MPLLFHRFDYRFCLYTLLFGSTAIASTAGAIRLPCLHIRHRLVIYRHSLYRVKGLSTGPAYTNPALPLPYMPGHTPSLFTVLPIHFVLWVYRCSLHRWTTSPTVIAYTHRSVRLPLLSLQVIRIAYRSYLYTCFIPSTAVASTGRSAPVPLMRVHLARFAYRFCLYSMFY